ncbi:MAG: hypothetical protein ACE5HC_06975 [Candidatus Binatia bacterium]
MSSHLLRFVAYVAIYKERPAVSTNRFQYGLSSDPTIYIWTVPWTQGAHAIPFLGVRPGTLMVLP